MSIQIVQEKFPFVGHPAAGLIGVSVECGGERGDEIEFASEVRQRLERANSPAYALDAEQLDQLVRQRIIRDVDAEPAMSKLFRKEEEKTRAAGEIEDLFRA